MLAMRFTLWLCSIPLLMWGLVSPAQAQPVVGSLVLPDDVASFDIHGDRMIVGVENGGDGSPALLRIYQRQGESWVVEFEWEVTPEAGTNTFRPYVALHGEFAVAGVYASYPDGNDMRGSRLYLLRHDGTSWEVEDEWVDLINPDFEGPYIPTLHESTLFIQLRSVYGSSQEGYEGAVLEYRRVGETWVEQAILTSPDPRNGSFAYSLEYDGTRLVISEPASPGFNAPSGKVFIYERNADAWEVDAVLSIDEEGDLFGRQLALQDDRLAVGSQFANGAGLVLAYVFEDPSWVEEARIARQGTSGDPFPYGVELGGDYLFAMQRSFGLNGIRVFEYESEGIIERGRLVPPDGPVGSLLIYYDGLLYSASGEPELWIYDPAQLLHPPVLSAPDDGTTLEGQETLLEWERPSGAVSFQLQLATRADFHWTSLLVDESGLPGTSHPVDGLDLSTTFYWRVRADDVAQTSIWSEVWSFSTNEGVPPAPELVYPLGEPAVYVPTTFRWATVPYADTYTLHVAETPDFQSLSAEVTVPHTSSGEQSVVVEDLEYMTTYYWRMRGQNPDATGDWSATGVFTTRFVAPPAAQLIAPENGEELPTHAVQLLWHAAPSADMYRVQWAYSSSFEDASEIVVGDTTFALPNLVPARAHYWRVESRGKDIGPWSEVRYFITLGTVGNDHEVPTNYALHAPYPNPFSTETQWLVEVPEPSWVRVDVLDMLGRRVETVLDGQLRSGRHRMVWTPNDLASGVYVIRVEASTFSASERVLLVR